jgi:hypothetical protein
MRINKGSQMKVQQILYSVCMIALALPMLANAEIYKWKDKNGVMRYSDTPPPANIKVDTLNKKNTAKPAEDEERGVGLQVPSPQEVPETAVGNMPKQASEIIDPPPDPQMEAARIRAQNAEAEKRNKLEKENQAKIDAENCKSARANLQSHTQGGRIYKMNEKGEREYMDEAGFEAGRAKAQADIQLYCK